MDLSRLIMSLSRYLLPGGSTSFWHTPIGAVTYDYSSLDYYYLDLSAKTAYKGPFDKEGIPMLDYRGNIGVQYNPCAASQYALGLYQLYRQGDKAALERFFNVADWLCQKIELDENNNGLWAYYFDHDAYGLKSPWYSALAQGQGVSVLLRAYLVSGNEDYLRTAKAAYSGMILPVEKGGLLRREGDDVYLEEVVADRKTAILDGMLFSLFAVQDLYFVTREEAVLNLLISCLDTIERKLPEYDLGYWSRADLYQSDPPMVASHFYHNLHVIQLGILGDMTGRAVFSEYSKRWQEYADSRLNRLNAFLKKVIFKLRYY